MIAVFQRPSIRENLTLTLLVGAGLMILAVALLLDLLIIGFLQDRFDEDLYKRGQTLITLTKVFDHGIELDYAGEFMPEFEEPEGPEYFELWLPDGSLLERSESLAGKPMPVSNEYTGSRVFQNIRMGHAGLCRVLRLSFIPQQEDADVEGRLDPSSRPDQAITLLVARKLDRFGQQRNGVRFLIWSALGLLLVLIVVLVRGALSKGLRPLDDIRRQVEVINPETLDKRIEPKRPVSELAPVIHQLNSLLTRLEEAVARERRFTSDVAHELRTPLAELRALSDVGLGDPDDRRMVLEFLNDVREITLEMQNMVVNLLDLSRCDNGTQTLSFDRVELNGLVQKTWQRAKQTAEAKGMTLVCTHEACTVFSDSLMLEQVLQNLINNAVAHGPPGDRITIEAALGASTGRVALTISNTAPTMMEEDLNCMFDRFWQKNQARTGGRSSGLGLALVKSFAALLYLEINTRLENGRFMITLMFPRDL